MRILFRAVALAGAVLLAVLLLGAAEGHRTVRVQFAKGASSATVQGTITGYEYVDYKVGARAGQTMTATLKTKNGSNYFNVLPPGSPDSAIFIGSTAGNEFRGTLAADGDYTLRVYLMRSAARRNEKAGYSLTVGVTGRARSGAAAPAPSPPAPDAPSVDAKVPGTPYHATGEIRCFPAGGGAPSSCPFGVVRQGQGTATVTVTRPDRSTRVIRFEKGIATGYDGGPTGAATFRATKESDLNIVLIGEERYEIPDAVVFGG